MEQLDPRACGQRGPSLRVWVSFIFTHFLSKATQPLQPWDAVSRPCALARAPSSSVSQDFKPRGSGALVGSAKVRGQPLDPSAEFRGWEGSWQTSYLQMEPCDWGCGVENFSGRKVLADRRTHDSTKPGQERSILSLPREALRIAGIAVWFIRQILTPLPLGSLRRVSVLGSHPCASALPGG